MNHWIKRAGSRLAGRMGYELVSHEALALLQQRAAEAAESRRIVREYDFLKHFPPDAVGRLMALHSGSHSQIGQDRFVLHELAFKRGGYFVEFGATNGVDLSNTFLLERDYGWTGILAEPAACWHEQLARNRRAAIDRRCVWSASGESVSFSEVQDAELSTISAFNASDMHLQSRRDGQTYQVETVSLVDLLDAHHAPFDIDYLSIDTEGSEFDILSTFDFSRYRFNVITVEHNYTPIRDSIHQLLSSNGYRRKFTAASLFDDWYVRQ